MRGLSGILEMIFTTKGIREKEALADELKTQLTQMKMTTRIEQKNMDLSIKKLTRAIIKKRDGDLSHVKK